MVHTVCSSTGCRLHGYYKVKAPSPESMHTSDPFFFLAIVTRRGNSSSPSSRRRFTNVGIIRPPLLLPVVRSVVDRMSFSAPQDSFSLRDEDDPHSPPPPFEDKVHKSPNARKQKLCLSRPFASRIWVEIQRTSVTVTLAVIGKSVTVADCHSFQ